MTAPRTDPPTPDPLADYLRENAAYIEDTLANHPEEAEAFAAHIRTLAALPSAPDQRLREGAQHALDWFALSAGEYFDKYGDNDEPTNDLIAALSEATTGPEPSDGLIPFDPTEPEESRRERRTAISLGLPGFYVGNWRGKATASEMTPDLCSEHGPIRGDSIAGHMRSVHGIEYDDYRRKVEEATTSPGATLDVAWREAEAALPEGDSFGEYDDESGHPSLVVETRYYTGPDHVEARAYRTPGYSDPVLATGPTPAAALLALAARLRCPA